MRRYKRVSLAGLAGVVCVLLTTSVFTFLNGISSKAAHMVQGRLNGNANRTLRGCQPLRRSQIRLPKTALASFPGSGNTWARHILQQATGILTGSVYDDVDLKRNGFPGEALSDNSVLVIKTHDVTPQLYEQAVLLVRHPAGTLLAEYNRRHHGHVGMDPAITFDTNPEWRPYVMSQATKWLTFNTAWLNSTAPLFILRYEDLVNNLRTTIADITRFLRFNMTTTLLDCVTRNAEGRFHRRGGGGGTGLMDLYDRDMRKHLNDTWVTFNSRLANTLQASTTKTLRNEQRDRQSITPK